MNSLLHAALDIQNFLESKGWKFCFIGGLALQVWGEPRVTNDVDITLLTGFGGEEYFIDALLEKFPARIDDARSFAIASRVLLLKNKEGVGIDIALAGFPFEEECISRARPFEFLPDCTLLCASPEDIIILKVFADRLKDREDVKSILIRQKGALDFSYILARVKPLCDLKEDPDIMQRFEDLLKKYAP